MKCESLNRIRRCLRWCRRIAAFAVIENPIVAPNSPCLLSSCSLDELVGARPRPLLPLVHIPVMHRIVVNVVDRDPKVALVSHDAIKASIPDVPSPSLVLFVPAM